jgi:hypothetical protein
LSSGGRERRRPVAGVVLRIGHVLAAAVEARGRRVKLLELVVVGAAGGIVRDHRRPGLLGRLRVRLQKRHRGSPLVFRGLLELAESGHPLSEERERRARPGLRDVGIVLDELGPGGCLLGLLAVLAVALADQIESGGGVDDVVREVVEYLLVGLDRGIPLVELVEAAAHPQEHVGQGRALRELERVGLVAGVGPLEVLLREELVGLLQVQALERVELGEVGRRVDDLLLGPGGLTGEGGEQHEHRRHAGQGGPTRTSHAAKFRAGCGGGNCGGSQQSPVRIPSLEEKAQFSVLGVARRKAAVG